MLIVSLTTFAILSRLIGPVAYAQFAVLAFVYTICALATDLSAMGYLLVHGDTPHHRRAAWKSALTSAACGLVILLIALLALSFAPLPQGPPGPVNMAVLGTGLVTQALVQPLRGRMMIGRSYARIATSDVIATVIAYGITVAIATRSASVTVLCVQLALTSLLRLVIFAALSPRNSRGPRTSVKSDLRDGLSTSVDPFRYGLQVMPLNVASYASRSIDSGILPLILPATAAATYSRSYQLIVTPITQVQLSLGGAIVERLARHESSTPEDRTRFDKRLWTALHALTFTAALVLSVSASLIQKVFFGPGWFHVDLMVASMAALLPSLALSSYMSWKLQIRADFRHSIVNLVVLMLVPFLAILLAAIAGTTGAVIGLIVGALTQAGCLAVLHRKFLPVSLRAALAQIAIEWLVLAALVFVRLL
ncbi:oligosaccharide flippase family protein [Curtobacterium sp. ISL-83]|nr:oligosaccharide flippase family protein [Curtobacterium sp. ISL-83]